MQEIKSMCRLLLLSLLAWSLFAQTPGYGVRTRVFTVTIANGASLSGAVDLAGYRVMAVQMPAALTGTSVTFQTSFDGTTYGNLYDTTGTEESAVVAASRVVWLEPATFVTFEYIKVRSGTAGTPTTELGDRIIKLLCRAL